MSLHHVLPCHAATLSTTHISTVIEKQPDVWKEAVWCFSIFKKKIHSVLKQGKYCALCILKRMGEKKTWGAAACFAPLLRHSYILGKYYLNLLLPSAFLSFLVPSRLLFGCSAANLLFQCALNLFMQLFTVAGKKATTTTTTEHFLPNTNQHSKWFIMVGCYCCICKETPANKFTMSKKGDDSFHSFAQNTALTT